MLRFLICNVGFYTLLELLQLSQYDLIHIFFSVLLTSGSSSDWCRRWRCLLCRWFLYWRCHLRSRWLGWFHLCRLLLRCWLWWIGFLRDRLGLWSCCYWSSFGHWRSLRLDFGGLRLCSWSWCGLFGRFFFLNWFNFLGWFSNFRRVRFFRWFSYFWWVSFFRLNFWGWWLLRSCSLKWIWFILLACI